MKRESDTDIKEEEDGRNQRNGTSSSALESLFEPPDPSGMSSSSLRDPLLEATVQVETPLQECSERSSRYFPCPFELTRRYVWTDENRRAARELIRRAGNYLAYATLLLMLLVIPQVIYRGIKTDHIDFAAYNSAGVMVLGTIVLSFRLVYLHLTHWYMPEVQKYVVRILWMVPLYAVQSWLSLRFHSSRIYIDTIRDLYEAYGKSLRYCCHET